MLLNYTLLNVVVICSIGCVVKPWVHYKITVTELTPDSSDKELDNERGLT